MMERRFSAAADRNKDALLAVLQGAFSNSRVVLEIASGTGQHALHLSNGLAHVSWYPTDLDEGSLASIECYRRDAPHDRIAAPRTLDVHARPWAIEADAIFACNLVHISPWSASEALFGGAGETLPVGGVLATYGPYRFADRPFAESNEQFDQWLKERDPSFGVRSVDALDELAKGAGLIRVQTVEMPANNHVLVWRRT